MIILKTKAFADNKKDKGNKDTTEDAMRGFVGKLIEDYMRNEKKKEHGRPSRQQRTLNRLKFQIDSTDNEIEIGKRKKELRDKKATLNKILNREKSIDKIKDLLDSPKFKKGAKTAGLITLGTGIGAGLTAGGIKLKNKIDEKRDNEKMKKSISEDQRK